MPICGKIIDAHTTLAPGIPGALTDSTTTENISENICAVFSSIPEILAMLRTYTAVTSADPSRLTVAPNGTENEYTLGDMPKSWHA